MNEMKAYSVHIKQLSCSNKLLKTYLCINLYQKEGSCDTRKICVHGLPTSLILIRITYLIIKFALICCKNITAIGS